MRHPLERISIEVVVIAVRGLQKTSLVDFPGEVCTTLFWGGCNLRCPWCHNADLVLRPWALPRLEIQEILGFLTERRSWSQAVCLTGGEPALDPELPAFVLKLKERGFKVKLDTNGTRPEVLSQLIDQDLLDYIAMDVKAPPDKYGMLAGVKVDLKAIRESIDIIRASEVAYEFRTTVVPGLLLEEDLLAIGRWLGGAKRYVLQQFRPAGSLLDENYRGINPYPEEFLHRAAARLRPICGEVICR
ncbi:MAG: pyruvate formate lyase activating enzyme [Clostridia bacterium]|nr:pyruvate formate lyase activating enzyme [Clostridia bacterium]